MGLVILYMYPCLWVYFTHFDYRNMISSGQMITYTGATKKGLFSIKSLTLTTNNNNYFKKSTSSFCLWLVPPWKAKIFFYACQTSYYYILLTYSYISCAWASDKGACSAQNQLSLNGVTKKLKNTINIHFVCTWPLLFESHTAFYNFLCAYTVGLNLLVSRIMFYMLSHVADYCCVKFFDWYGVFYTLVVENCCCLKFLARIWLGVEYWCLIT